MAIIIFFNSNVVLILLIPVEFVLDHVKMGHVNFIVERICCKLLQDGNIEPHFISCSNGSSTIASFDEVLHLHPEMRPIFSCA